MSRDTLPPKKSCLDGPGRREVRKVLATGWVPLSIRGKAWESSLYRDCLAAELRVSVLEGRLARVLRCWMSMRGEVRQFDEPRRDDGVWSGKRRRGSP